MFCCPFLVIFDYSFVGEIATVPHIVGFVVFSTHIEFHWSMIMPFNLPFKAIKKPKISWNTFICKRKGRVSIYLILGIPSQLEAINIFNEGYSGWVGWLF